MSDQSGAESFNHLHGAELQCESDCGCVGGDFINAKDENKLISNICWCRKFQM